MFRVLLPVDESETRTRDAIDVVTSLPGDPEEYEITILNVNEDTQQPWIAELETFREADEEGLLPETFEMAKDLLEAEGYTVNQKWEVGEAADEIVKTARYADVDHIVLSGRKKSATKKVLFGSVAQQVLLNSDRPVTLTMSD